MKRILALVLSVLMLASCFVIATSAEEADLAAVYAGAQTKSYTTADGDFYDVRFLATIDETALTNKNVIFNITANYADGKQDFVVETNTAYVSVLEGEKAVTASTFNADHEYLCAVAVKGISKAKANVTFDVKVDVVTAADETVAAETNNVVTFNDGANVRGIQVKPSFYAQSHSVYSATDGDKANMYIFDGIAKSRFLNYKSAGAGWISAKFDVPTVITEINFYVVNDNCAGRSKANYFEASVDGTNWVSLDVILPLELTTGTLYTLKVSDATAYNYIKCVQGTSGWWTLGAMSVKGIYDGCPVEPKTITHRADMTTATPNGAGDIVSTIWDYTDTNSKYTAAKNSAATAGAIIAGEFSTPTVIDKVVYYVPPTNGNRIRTSFIEVSATGEEGSWVIVATLTGDNNQYEKGVEFIFDVNDNTEYKFIRVRQADAFKAEYLSVGTIVVY